MKGNGHRVLKHVKCGFEADRDSIAILNIEKRALFKMGNPTTPWLSTRVGNQFYTRNLLVGDVSSMQRKYGPGSKH